MVCALSAALLAGAAAGLARAGYTNGTWGAKWLQYGDCCSGALLQGTRAAIAGLDQVPDSTSCILYSSVVSGEDVNDGDLQLEAGLAKCGADTDLDENPVCAFSEMTKYDEVAEAAGSGQEVYYCHNDGSAYQGQYYEVSLQESSATSGDWYAYINGTAVANWPGFDNSVRIQEWGEHEPSTSCTPRWTADADFENWQRYNYSNGSWYTIEQSDGLTQNCWTVSALDYNSRTNTNSFDVGGN